MSGIKHSATRGECLRHALLLGVLLALLFPGTIFRGEMISPGDILFEVAPWNRYAPPDWVRAANPLMSDMLTAFAPYYAATERALDAGEWPLWNPYELAGIPLLANWQSAVFYPPRLLHAFLDLHVATTLCVLLKLWLCGMTAYLCGRGLKLSAGSARFFSVAWMMGGYCLIWANWPITDVSAWFPLGFLAVEWLLEGRYRKGFWLAAVAGVLTLLAGHPESGLALHLGLGLYLGVRLLLEHGLAPRKWTPLAVWLGAWGLAVLVCAVQILPFLEYLANSYQNPGKTNTGPHPGFSAGHVVVFWVQRFFGTHLERNYWNELDTNRSSMLYAGIPVWAGLSLLLVRGTWRPETRRRTVALAATSLFLVLLAFEMPPFDALHDLPVLNLMKRTYHIAFPMFALPLLAATGYDRWFARARKLREAGVWLGAMILIATVVGIAYRFHGPLLRALNFTPYLHRQLLLGGCAQAACLLLLAASTRSRRPAAYLIGFASVLVVDLAIAGNGFNPTLPRKDVFPDTKLTRFLESRPSPCRISVLDSTVAPGLLVPYSIEDCSGYDGIYPKRLPFLLNALRTRVWNAMEPACAIDYYLLDAALKEHNPQFAPSFPIDDPAYFQFVDRIDGVQVYKNLRAFPRAFLVGRATVLENAKDLFDRMSESSFDPSREVLLDRAPAGPLPRDASPIAGAARVTRRTGTRVSVEAEADRDCILVLADSYYPGWTARLDGRDVEIFPANYAYRGVLLPAGKHRVEFTYAPWSFRAGLCISIAALFAGSLFALLHAARRRRD